MTKLDRVLLRHAVKYRPRPKDEKGPRGREKLVQLGNWTWPRVRLERILVALGKVRGAELDLAEGKLVARYRTRAGAGSFVLVGTEGKLGAFDVLSRALPPSEIREIPLEEVAL